MIAFLTVSKEARGLIPGVVYPPTPRVKVPPGIVECDCIRENVVVISSVPKIVPIKNIINYNTCSKFHYFYLPIMKLHPAFLTVKENL